MFCKKCGEEINDDARFCTKCGARVKANEGVHINNALAEREKVFRTKQSTGLIYLACTAVLIISAVVDFFGYSELPKYFYAEERATMFMLGVFCSVIAVECVVLAIGRIKVKLCVRSQTVSGIAARGILVREFEYAYDEISEVKCMLGCIKIRANGRWVVMPGLENKEKAKEMIEERIVKY